MVQTYRVIYSYLSRKDGESDLVALARQIATQAHSGQKRKRSSADYIIHPTRISARLRGAGASEIAQAAALLHDVIEDTHITEKDLREMFPPQVVDFVKALSKWWPDDADYEGLDLDQKKYEDQIKSHTDTMIIKLHDISDNLDEDRRVLLSLLKQVQAGLPVNSEVKGTILYIRRGIHRFKEKNRAFAEEVVGVLSPMGNRAAQDAVRHWRHTALSVDKIVDFAADVLAEVGIQAPSLP